MAIIKDRWGIQLKYPDRKCEDCLWYPCMVNFHIFHSPFAVYGCKDYKMKQNE
jgi:hypothetical protein